MGGLTSDDDQKAPVDKDSDELVEIGLDRVQAEQETFGSNQDVEEENFEEEEELDSEEIESRELWYSKLTFFIDHVREVSYSLIHVLGTFLSLDEMMIRFFGRSVETHRMKNKPIKEGYNFFVLTTKTGYVVNFTPDGRTAATKDRQEYKVDKTMGKIETMIMFVLLIIKRKKDEEMKGLEIQL